MNNVAVRFGFVSGCLGLLAASAMAGGQIPTIALKAVKVNPTCVGGADEGNPCTRFCECDSLVCGDDPANGHGDIPNTSSLVASPGDTIVVEIFASEWSPTGATPERLRAFQAAPDLTALIAGQPRSTGDRGELTILQGDRCCSQLCDNSSNEGDSCMDNSECPGGTCKDIGRDCSDVAGPGVVCTNGVCNLAPAGAGAFMDRRQDTVNFPPTADPRLNRFDYVFFFKPELPALDLTSAPAFVRYASSLSDVTAACTYDAPNPGGGCVEVAPRYLGTLVLVASPDACGVFTLPYLEDLSQTQLLDIGNNPIFPVGGGPEDVNRQELTIDLGPCECLNIIASDPPNCAIDARQPSDPDGFNPQGWNSVTLTFDCIDTDNTAINTLSNWQVTQQPDGFPIAPFVDTIAPSGSDVMLTFTRNISKENWTCVRYLPGVSGANRICLGILPGDADANVLTEEMDVPGLKDCLDPSNPALCEEHKCDTDLTGRCAPPDILRLIDLLNGAVNFDDWLGAGITEVVSGDPIFCPSAPKGACCVGLLNVCEGTFSEAQCDFERGTWFDGEDCATFMCPTVSSLRAPVKSTGVKRRSRDRVR